MISMTTARPTKRERPAAQENNEEREEKRFSSIINSPTRLASTISSRIYALPNSLHFSSSLWLARLEALPRRVIHGMVQAVPTVTSASSTVQRVLQQDSSPLDMTEYKSRCSKDLKADNDVQSIQKQIRALKQQLQQARSQRQLQKKKQLAQREKDQKHYEAQLLKYKQLLDNHHNPKQRKESYTKALAKASGRSTSTTYLYFPKALTSSSTSSSPTAQERQAQQLEADIVRTMHMTMVYQKQCDMAENYAEDIKASLKRERATMDDQQAEAAMYQMILEGTQRALMGLYPEIVLRQEALLGVLFEASPRIEVPRLILPPPPRSPAETRRTGRLQMHSNSSSDGISDLGESLIADSITETESTEHHPRCFGSPHGPVFTSVHALQQNTLQQRAGVESF